MLPCLASYCRAISARLWPNIRWPFKHQSLVVTPCAFRFHRIESLSSVVGTCPARKITLWIRSSSYQDYHKYSQVNLCTKVTPNLKTMKLDTQEFHALFTPELTKLVELFSKYNYELRIAGGAARDLLMDLVPHDVDFATTATPEEMKSLFKEEGIRMINMQGEKHGTITCRINDKENFEVTTLRIDLTTDGRHAEVQFTKDWQLDSLRRDLTINSMFLGFDGTLYDYFNGREDLRQKRVRFVGNACDRIQEDYLRILRYFRFYGRISAEANAHEQTTLKAIRDNVHGLAGISGERLWMELKRILTGRHADSLVKVIMECGLAPYIGLPTEPNTDEFDRVFSRCHDLDPQPLTLLTSLMKDELEVYKLHERVKMSRDELRLSLFIALHRDADFGRDPFRHCQDIQCDTAGKDSKTKDRICELLKYLGHRDTLKQFSEWMPPRFPVDGHKLIEMGVPKGPQFAKVLDGLRQAWKESAYVLKEEELLTHVPRLKQENNIGP